MTNLQLYLAVALPVLLNTAITAIAFTLLSQRITDLQTSINHRFDDQQRSWFEALRRVEEVIDARLKHLEER